MAQRGRHSAYGAHYSQTARYAQGARNVQRARHAAHAGSAQRYSYPTRSQTPGEVALEVSRYSRGNYGNHAKARRGHHAKRRHSTAKRVVIGILIAFAVVLAAAGAYAFWFMSAFDNATRPSDELSEQLDDVLVNVSLDEPFYMLLLGSDSREGSGTSKRADQSGDQERSDVIMLVRVDAPNKKLTFVSVPRDTPYTLDDGRVVKINETYNIGGAALCAKAVSEVTGAPISHFAEVHLSGLEAIVDYLGGVEVYVDRRLRVKDALTGDAIIIEPGKQVLNGKEAQAFARNRHAYKDSSEGQESVRQSHVRTLLEAIVHKIVSQPVIELQNTILNLAQYVTTDLQAADFVKLGLAFAGGDMTIYSCTGPSDGDFFEEYDGVWLCYANPEGWAELMRQVDAGLDPQEIDYASTQQRP